MYTRNMMRAGHFTLRPRSGLDVGASCLLVSAIIAIWHVGDFHTLHDGDTVIYSLASLYHWTPFVWEYDHVGSLLPLLASPFHRPYLNLLTLSALNSFAFLYGLILWAGLLSRNELTLTEGGVWVSLLTVAVMPKAKIFSASTNNPWSLGFFFAGLFAHVLQGYLQRDRCREKLAASPALFILAFLTVYVSKISLVPLLIITPGLVWENLQRRGQWPLKFDKALLSHLAPLLWMALALLSYQLLEQSAEFKSGLALDPANIQQALPRLLGRWLDEELNAPWLVLGFLLLLYRPLDQPMLRYLTAGMVSEAIIISSSSRAGQNDYPSIYLADLTFLLLLLGVIALALLVNRFKFKATWAVAVPGLLFLNAIQWHSFPPVNPFAQLDRTIGASTPAIVEAECDLLLGDYWKVWPAVLAANDYYYRQNIIDPRTGQTRLLAGITYRAWPTEDLWRPRFDWPDAKLCSFAGDDEGVASAIRIYAPDIILLMSPKDQVGPIVVSQLENRRLPSLGFEFDNTAPGPGWHGQEITPDGQTFQWMKERAELVLPLAADHDFTLRFRVRPALAPGILPSLTLAVNEHPVTLASYPEANGDTTFEAAIPKTLLDNPRYTQLVFRVSHTAIPDKIYGNGDTRALGLAFDWLRLDPVTAARP